MDTVHENELEYFVDKSRAICSKCGAAEQEVFPRYKTCKKDYERALEVWRQFCLKDWVLFTRLKGTILLIHTALVTTGGIILFHEIEQIFFRGISMLIFLFVVSVITLGVTEICDQRYQARLNKLRILFSSKHADLSRIDKITAELGT